MSFPSGHRLGLHNTMTNNMANRSQHPSVYEKIHGQSYLISRLSHNRIQQNRKYGLSCRYLMHSGFHNPNLQPTSQGTVLPAVSLLSRDIFVEAPLERKTTKLASARVDVIKDCVVSEIVAAPLKRVKLFRIRMRCSRGAGFLNHTRESLTA